MGKENMRIKIPLYPRLDEIDSHNKIYDKESFLKAYDTCKDNYKKAIIPIPIIDPDYYNILQDIGMSVNLRSIYGFIEDMNDDFMVSVKLFPYHPTGNKIIRYYNDFKESEDSFCLRAIADIETIENFDETRIIFKRIMAFTISFNKIVMPSRGRGLVTIYDKII